MTNYAEERTVRGCTIAGFALLEFRATLSPAIVATVTCAAESAAVPGVLLGDIPISVVKATEQAGLGLAGFRVSADDVVEINFCNPTAAGITPTAAELYVFTVLRAGTEVGPGLS